MTRYVILITFLASTAAAQAPRTPPVLLTHGPMLGHITSNSISIWARTSTPGAFQVRYGTSPGNLDQVSGPVTTTAVRDNTGWVQLTGLKPNVRYYYLPFTRNDAGDEGTFLTLPSSEDYRDPETNPRGLFNFRFQFGSCANQKPGNGTGPGLPAYETMLRTLAGKVHFSIMNGDWLYEDKREFTVEDWKPRPDCPMARSRDC
jgi:alkaline phosphatase D